MPGLPNIYINYVSVFVCLFANYISIKLEGKYFLRTTEKYCMKTLKVKRTMAIFYYYGLIFLIKGNSIFYK